MSFRRLTRSLLAAGLATTLAAAEPAPLASIQVADAQRLLQHWNAGPFARAWQDPAVAPLRAWLDRRMPEVVAQVGFDPFAVLAASASCRLVVTGLGTADDQRLQYHLQADLGAKAAAVFAAIAKHGTPVAMDGCDGAVDLGSGADAMRVMLSGGRWLVATPADRADPRPQAVAGGADLDLRLDGPVLAEHLLGLMRGGPASKRPSPEAEALLRKVLPLATCRTDLVADGFSSALSVSGTWAWLRPVDLRLLERLPPAVNDCSMVAIDGPALWQDLGAPLLAVLAQYEPGLKPDQALARLGAATTWADLVQGATGTWMLAQSAGMPLPGYSLIIPRSPAIDAVVAALVRQGGGELPPEGESLPIPLGKGVPVMLSLARDRGHWLATTDTAMPAVWLGQGGAGWHTTPLGRLALEKAGTGACALAVSDTGAQLRSLGSTLGMLLSGAKELSPAERQAVIALVQRLAALAKPGWSTLRHAGDHLEGDSVGLTGGSANLGLVAVAAGMALPAVNQVRDNARKAASGNNLRQLALACVTWASQHDGAFPPSLASLDKQGVSDKLLRSPAAPERADAYLYVRPCPDGTSLQPLIVEDPAVWRGKGCMVVYCDGHVGWLDRTRAQKTWDEARRLAALPAAAAGGIRPEDWEGAIGPVRTRMMAPPAAEPAAEPASAGASF
jgi:prepilin-type processing-associated H-X9-DG protein